MVSFSLGCVVLNEEEGEGWVSSYKGRQELCGLVASKGKKHIGNRSSLVGNALCGNR